VPSVVKAVHTPTKDTAGVELASVAEGAATAKHEALEPWGRGEDGRARDMAPRDGSTDGERALEALL
jgi:hypothetical protein